MAELEEQNGNDAEVTGAEVTDLDAKIIRQIEFYFGDHNLSRDKFMKSMLSENDGWIPFDVLMKFNRLKILTTEHTAIVSALQKSKSGLLEIAEDKQKIRRTPQKPVPDYSEEWKTDTDSRTVYVKGFPLDSSLDELLEFFKTQGNIDHVYMRKTFGKNAKAFKGSVFATFATKDGMEEFLKKDNVMYKETELLRETKEAYFTRKREEVRVLQEERKKIKDKRKLDGDENDADPAEKKDRPDFIFKKGTLLHLSGFQNDTSREDIKEVFDNHCKILWVLFRRGDTEAWLQLDGEDSASPVLQKILDANNGALVVRSNKVTAEVVQSDKEQEIWNNIRQSRLDIIHKKRFGGPYVGHRKPFRGGRNFSSPRGGRNKKDVSVVGLVAGIHFQGKKRKFDSDDEESKPKDSKIEKVSAAADEKMEVITTAVQENVDVPTKMDKTTENADVAMKVDKPAENVDLSMKVDKPAENVVSMKVDKPAENVVSVKTDKTENLDVSMKTDKSENLDVPKAD